MLWRQHCLRHSSRLFLQRGQVPLTNKTRCGSSGSHHSLGLCFCVIRLQSSVMQPPYESPDAVSCMPDCQADFASRIAFCTASDGAASVSMACFVCTPAPHFLVNAACCHHAWRFDVLMRGGALAGACSMTS